jgi:1,4-dihydroxy-2-naphthoyl-CoA hydrolase
MYMAILKQATPHQLNALSENSAAQNCGIQFTAVGDDWVEAVMPINEGTRGPNETLPLGWLAILAETVGSVAASLAIDSARDICLGQSLQVYHLEPVHHGPVRARATPTSIGERNHIWNIQVYDPAGTLVSAATLTMVVLPKERLAPVASRST